jgi:hypothetical protein
MDVMAEVQSIGALSKAGDLAGAVQRVWALWESITDPKVEVPNAYLVIEYGVALSLKLNDLDQARQWADFAPPFAAKRHDVGEVEFLIGRVAFARGEFDIARANFSVANVKSEGRIFHGEDKKYKQLLGSFAGFRS